MDEYFSEKLKLFKLNKDNGSSVVMIDDEYGKRITELNSNVKCISLKRKMLIIFAHHIALIV